MKIKLLTALATITVACPAFADTTPDIAAGANTADCDSDVLKTTSGSANLEANWNPNTISLNWYADDTLLTVQTGAQTCTYDGAITLPTTQPTKPGYTFARWQVRQQSCFAGVDVSEGYNAYYWGLGMDEYWPGEEPVIVPKCSGYQNGQQIRMHSDTDLACVEELGIEALEYNEIKIVLNTGILKLEASCNDEGVSSIEELEETPAVASLVAQWEAGTITEEQAMEQLRILMANEASRPADAFNANSTGKACWCRAKSFTPNGGSTCVSSGSKWVTPFSDSTFGGNYDSAEQCAQNCSNYCARSVVDPNDNDTVEGFYDAIFGISQ